MLRRLKGEKKSLPRDPYAIPDSPEKPIKFTKPEDPAPEFSPRRENKPRLPNGGRTKQKSKLKTLELLKERRISQRQLAVPDVGIGELKSPQETPRRSPRKHASDVVPSGDSSSAKTVRTTRSTSKHQELASEDVEEQVAITNEDDLAPSDSNGVSGVDVEEIPLGTNSSHASPQGPLRRGPGRPLGSTNKKGPGRSIKRKAKQSKVNKKLIPQILRISQIDFPDAGQRNALEDTVMGDEAEVEQERTRKRKTPPSSSQRTANPRKRAQGTEGRGAKVDRQSEAEQEKAKRHATERARAAEDERQEQIEHEQREHDDQIRASWLQLHDERRYVEPFGPAEKLRHLRMPDPPIECDQNDEQYVRIELFKRRIGPHPVYVKNVLEQVWSEEEIAALEHGLRQFAGERVFQEIFRAHCGRKGALNKYNVTEIVTTAADMKAHWTEEQMEEYGEVEDWVQQIPLWINIPTSSGQENASAE